MEEDRTVETISNWRKSVERKMFDFEGNPSMAMEQGRGYGSMENLLLVRVSADYSANFYFDQEGGCKLVYVTDLEVLFGMKVSAIVAHFGKAEAELRSRLGDRYEHFAYPAHGFAFSTRGDQIRFFEVFEPMTVAEYQESIYGELGPW